ncbi:High-affinity potassium transport protein [Dissostichus eleginoides]|uniref:High-affinity potassium transport protein n=1 Tax=Dissostichus eleginoides TaxID=100907 RepID=A0AAD9FGI5_DISEL|nr:High-affinity potassium transport protein [Dissostichus eleginoides]
MCTQEVGADTQTSVLADDQRPDQLWQQDRCPNIYRALAALECRGRAEAESSSRGKPLLSSTSADSFPFGQSVNTDSARDVSGAAAKLKGIGEVNALENKVLNDASHV